MALTTLTHKWQKITVPANTTEHTINFSAVLQNTGLPSVYNGVAILELVSGASVQISPNATIDSDSPAITTAFPKAMIDIRGSELIRYKGGAGSEVFNISILSEQF